jgi:hypothetical protein
MMDGASVSADYCALLTPLIRKIESGKIAFHRTGGVIVIALRGCIVQRRDVLRVLQVPRELSVGHSTFVRGPSFNLVRHARPSTTTFPY